MKNRTDTAEIDHPSTTEPIACLNAFFEMYSSVKALCQVTDKENESVGLFLSSKADLDRTIDSLATSNEDNLNLRLANLHALQGLVHWLHPSCPEFERTKNAKTMLGHANAAVKLSETTSSCDSCAVGIFVQLRISSFLMRAKLTDEGQLLRARERAHSFVESITYGPEHDQKRLDLLGIVLDGLGFSYYQVEGDTRIALHYLLKAYDSLRAELAALTSDHGLDASSPLLPCKKSFVRGMSAVTLWDIGNCYESEAEQSDGVESVPFYKKARAAYSKSLTISKSSPWHIYKALSAYGIAGTFVKELELRTDLSDSERKRLVSRALVLGDEASSFMRMWSTLEADMLGGVANALFHQRMADLCEGEERKACMERSLELISRAELAARKREGSRYSNANFGDLYLRGAIYYYESSNGSANGFDRDFLETSLKNCEASQNHFDERHCNRMVDSLILGAKVCCALVKFNSASEACNGYRVTGQKYCQRSMSICRRKGWDARLEETIELSTILERVKEV